VVVAREPLYEVRRQFAGAQFLPQMVRDAQCFPILTDFDSSAAILIRSDACTSRLAVCAHATVAPRRWLYKGAYRSRRLPCNVRRAWRRSSHGVANSSAEISVRVVRDKCCRRVAPHSRIVTRSLEREAGGSPLDLRVSASRQPRTAANYRSQHRGCVKCVCERRPLVVKIMRSEVSASFSPFGISSDTKIRPLGLEMKAGGLLGLYSPRHQVAQLSRQSDRSCEPIFWWYLQPRAGMFVRCWEKARAGRRSFRGSACPFDRRAPGDTKTPEWAPGHFAGTSCKHSQAN
jgi:hypothetical protein